MKRCLTMFVLLTLILNAPAADDGQPIFNGKSLAGWVAEGAKEYKDGDKTVQVWNVEDGQLICRGKGYGFLRYDKEYSDFVFHLEFKLAPKANSGIGIRTGAYDPKNRKVATAPSMFAYEIQLLDDAGKAAHKHGTGSLYRYVAPKSNPVKKAGEWNVMDIECVGPRIKVTLNGELIHDVDQSTIAAIKNKPLKGCVCLQNHGGHIEFRNLRVKDLGK